VTGEQAKERTRHLRMGLDEILRTTLGRRWLYGFLEDSGVFRESFSESPLLMANTEGKRSRGLALLLELQDHFPTACEQVLREGLAWRHELLARKSAEPEPDPIE